MAPFECRLFFGGTAMNRRLIILLLICVSIASLYLLPRGASVELRRAQEPSVLPYTEPVVSGASLVQEDFTQLLERPLFDPSRRLAPQVSSSDTFEMSRINGWKLVGVFVGHGCMIKLADESVRFLRLNEEVDSVVLVSIDSSGAAFDWGDGVHRLELQRPGSILVPAQ